STRVQIALPGLKYCALVPTSARFRCLYVFFSWCAVRRALHSFPTRRSSDLAHPHSDCTRTVALVHNGIIENADVLRKRLEQDGQDRKSTRLNSSHVEISYAVFCLKKKKI